MEKGNKKEIPVPKPKRSIKSLLLLGSVVATVYIWSLPLLSSWGYANSGSVGSPEPLDKNHSETLSGYISSNPATGGMAAVFFLPIMFMW